MPRFIKARVRGRDLRFEVADVAKMEAANAYVCALWDGPRYFDDDMRGVCVGCGVAVRYRPYGPTRPPKVCMSCAPGWIAATRH